MLFCRVNAESSHNLASQRRATHFSDPSQAPCSRKPRSSSGSRKRRPKLSRKQVLLQCLGKRAVTLRRMWRMMNVFWACKLACWLVDLLACWLRVFFVEFVCLNVHLFCAYIGVVCLFCLIVCLVVCLLPCLLAGLREHTNTCRALCFLSILLHL